MVLAIDIGNTTIAFTGLERVGGEISCPDQEPEEDFEVLFTAKIPTEAGKNQDLFLEEAEKVLRARGIDFDQPRVSAAAVSSVVPACTPSAQLLAGKLTGKKAVVISWTCRTGLSFETIPAPDRVGADRVADAAWAAARYPLPAMTVDMGTATTINVVSADRKFLGGMIGSGVRTSLHSLRTGTAQLPELVPQAVPREKLIGTDTAACMLSAAVVGTAAMIDGLAGHVEEQIGSPLTLILTGGNARAVAEWIRHSYVLEPDLAAKGTALIALREQERDTAF